MATSQDGQREVQRVPTQRVKQEGVTERERRSLESKNRQAWLAERKETAASRTSALEAQVRVLQTLLAGSLGATARPNLEHLGWFRRSRRSHWALLRDR